jgi:hypothetical protein
MDSEQAREPADQAEQATSAQFTEPDETVEVPAWEQVDTGRYMPRRIKGSCRGRALG